MCLYIDDFDSDFQTLRDGWRAARTCHWCTECRRRIDPGERYYHQDAVDQLAGGVWTWKMCRHCRAAIRLGAQLTGCPEAWFWDSVWSEHPDEGFAANVLDHDLSRAVRFRFLRCVAAARRGWRWHDGSLMPEPAPGRCPEVPA